MCDIIARLFVLLIMYIFDASHTQDSDRPSAVGQIGRAKQSLIHVAIAPSGGVRCTWEP